MIEFVKNNVNLVVDVLQILTARLNIWWMLFYAVCYVLLSLGLYTLAKQRVLDRPWLAWLPIGNLWILGCLADQYRHLVTDNEKANSKNRLFWLSVAAGLLVVAIVVLLVVGMAYISKEAPIMSVSNESLSKLEALTGDQLSEGYLHLMLELVAADESVARTVSVGLIGLGVLLVALTVCVVWLAVEQYIALYYLYASSLPKHRVWFLVVSIVFSVESFFVFACRKQNQGMPHDKKGRLQVL